MLALSHASPTQPFVSGHNDGFPSREAHLKYDIILESYGQWGFEASCVGPAWADRSHAIASSTNPWISAVDNPVEYFTELPPCFVANGELECLVDEGIELVARIRKAGVPVEHDIAVSWSPLSVWSRLTLSPFIAPRDPRLLYHGNIAACGYQDLPQGRQVGSRLGSQPTLRLGLVAPAHLFDVALLLSFALQPLFLCHASSALQSPPLYVSCTAHLVVSKDSRNTHWLDSRGRDQIKRAYFIP